MEILSDSAFIDYCELITEFYSNTSLLVREKFDKHAKDRKLSPFIVDNGGADSKQVNFQLKTRHCWISSLFKRLEG